MTKVKGKGHGPRSKLPLWGFWGEIAMVCVCAWVCVCLYVRPQPLWPQAMITDSDIR